VLQGGDLRGLDRYNLAAKQGIGVLSSATFATTILSGHVKRYRECVERATLMGALVEERTFRRDRGGTFEKSEPSPSPIVGCARMASRSLGYGRPASIAVCTAAMTSPASAPIIVKPRMRS